MHLCKLHFPIAYLLRWFGILCFLIHVVFCFQEAAFDADRVFMAAIDKFNAMMSKGNVHAPDGMSKFLDLCLMTSFSPFDFA